MYIAYLHYHIIVYPLYYHTSHFYLLLSPFITLTFNIKYLVGRYIGHMRWNEIPHHITYTSL